MASKDKLEENASHNTNFSLVLPFQTRRLEDVELPYSVYVAPAFKRDLKKLDRKVQKRIIDALDSLSTDPRPKGVEKLKENPKFYRISVGDHRLVYSIDDKKLIIVACLARHRKDVYRDIANLNISAVLETLKPLLVGSRPSSS